MVKFTTLWLILFLTFQLQGCATTCPPPTQERPATIAIYHPPTAAAEHQILLRYAPCFEVECPQKDYNLIGTPSARMVSVSEPQIFIDTNRATIYTMTQKFTTGGSDYTNLIYRVHFPEVPPGHLTRGRNVGLLVYVTLNNRDEPVLITTLHTCGCYLAMIPTSNLGRDKWPDEWSDGNQNIYGEKLPGHLELNKRVPDGRLVIRLRNATHRVMGMEFRGLEIGKGEAALEQTINLAPMSDLDQIPLNGSYISFFEKEGPRKGHVKESHKPLEKLLMGWWALDLLVGEDKALGPPEEIGATFYTSLKFWARKESNIWNFPQFLKYWGWNL